MGTQHPGDSLHGLQPAAHDTETPVIQKASGPVDGFVLPEVRKGLNFTHQRQHAARASGAIHNLQRRCDENRALGWQLIEIG